MVYKLIECKIVQIIVWRRSVNVNRNFSEGENSLEYIMEILTNKHPAVYAERQIALYYFPQAIQGLYIIRMITQNYECNRAFKWLNDSLLFAELKFIATIFCCDNIFC